MARNPTPPVDSATIRSCGELLKGLDESRRLNSNPLAAQLSASLDQSEIARIVRAAFEELTARQREIVTRCDIGGEGYAAAALALHVSERHLFRERRTALGRIARRLLREGSTTARATVSFAPDPVEVQMALGEALDKSGNWRAAAQTLEQLAADLSVPDQCGRVEVRLARLYREAGRIPPAYHHAGLARTLASQATSDGDLLRVEADVAVAGVAMYAGDWAHADELVQQTIARLRPSVERSVGTRVSDALAQALLFKAELLIDNGGADRAFNLASEACRLVGQNPADASLEIGSRMMVALTSSFLARDINAAEEMLLGCYRAALARGLVREALIIATHLSVQYRLFERSADALRLLVPLVGTARAAGTGWVQTAILSELVHASLDTGALDAAASYAADLSTRAGNNPSAQAWVGLSRARLHLARGEFAPALEVAEAAEKAYASRGLQRYFGISLRMQAEALAGLRESERAERIATRAIDALKDASHPRPLAAAYRVMARIAGRRGYAVTARKLLHDVRAASRRAE